MRPLLLFLAVLLAFFAILKFYPAGEGGEVAAGGGPPADTGFLERPLRAPVTPASGYDAEPVVTPSRIETPLESADSTSFLDVAVGDEPSWLDDFEGVSSAGPEAIELAGWMVHERCAGLAEHVARLVPDLAEDQQRMIIAFGHAYRGDLQRARDVAQGIAGALPEMEERFLRAAMEGTRPPLRPRSALAHGPVVLAMSLLSTERLVEEDLAAKGWAPAIRGLSDLLLAELDAPWAASRPQLLAWASQLNGAQERHRWHPRGVWPSSEVEVLSGDSLSSVLARYRRENPARKISTGLVALVNGIEKGLIHAGDPLRVPTEEVRVRVSLQHRLLLVTMDGEVAMAWECAIGREGQETTPGAYCAGYFEKNPVHWPKGQSPIPFGDPSNPLGTRWIGWWDADQSENNLSLGFHGTNAPETVGQAASLGCVRMHNADVELLYAILPKYAPIRVE